MIRTRQGIEQTSSILSKLDLEQTSAAILVALWSNHLRNLKLQMGPRTTEICLLGLHQILISPRHLELIVHDSRQEIMLLHLGNPKFWNREKFPVDSVHPETNARNNWVFPKMGGTQKGMVCHGKPYLKLFKMDDLGVPLLSETSN